jgi:hypothetical protein
MIIVFAQIWSDSDTLNLLYLTIWPLHFAAGGLRSVAGVAQISAIAIVSGSIWIWAFRSLKSHGFSFAKIALVSIAYPIATLATNVLFSGLLWHK